MISKVGKVLVLIFLPTGLLADTSSDSSASSSSGVYIGGNSQSNTPSVGGSSNNTSSCVIGNSFGVGVPGFGINVGAGRVDQECNVREEAKALLTLVGERAALAHLCKHDKTIRETLVEQGLCVVEK